MFWPRLRGFTFRWFIPSLLVPVLVSSGPAIGKDPVGDPVEAELRFQRAVVRQMEGDFEAVLSELDDGAAGDREAMFLQAVALLETGRLEAGAELLEDLLAAGQGPPEAELYLAMAYLHLDRLDLAESLTADLVAGSPHQDYAHYLRGVCLARMGQAQMAEASFRSAGISTDLVRQVSHASPASFQPSTTAPAPRDLYVSPVVSSRNYGARSKPWSVSVLTAIEYDSNVTLSPEFSGLGSALLRDEDSRLLIASFGEYLVVDTPYANFGAVWSTFDTFQFELDDLNLHDYMAGAYAHFAVGSWVVGGRYEFHETLVQRQHFADEHRLTANASYVGNPWGHTTFYYEYDRVDSNAIALIPQQFQGGNAHAGGITQAFYTAGGDGRVYLGYRWDWVNAYGTDFDRRINMLTARIEHPLHWGMIADAEVRIFYDDFREGNSLDFFGRPRKDRRVEFRTGVQKNLPCDWAVRVDYTFVNNDSTTENLFGVEFYEYDRHIVSTQIIRNF